MTLDQDEEKVNKYLLNLKKEELKKERLDGRSLQEDIFMDVKDKIEQNPVFKIIRKMPKGKI